MTIQEKLQIISQSSGLTQTELAQHLGVSFVAFNRWVNGRANPRPEALKKIDELYREYSGQKEIPTTVLDAKRELLDAKRASHPNVLAEILRRQEVHDEFLLSLTFNSNSIEGSTLTKGETAAILFQNVALPDKTLVEQLEAKNHQPALEYLFRYMTDGLEIDEAFILRLHAILMNGIRPDAGLYRNHGVRIMGVELATANHLKIPDLMKVLVRDMRRSGTAEIIVSTAETHARFEQIHPFSDGNGRVGRILMHAMLLKADFPPAVIRQEQRRAYMLRLNQAQTRKDTSPLVDLVCDAVLEGYKLLEQP